VSFLHPFQPRQNVFSIRGNLFEERLDGSVSEIVINILGLIIWLSFARHGISFYE
jgi:hypothetical protein